METLRGNFTKIKEIVHNAKEWLRRNPSVGIVVDTEVIETDFNKVRIVYSAGRNYLQDGVEIPILEEVKVSDDQVIEQDIQKGAIIWVNPKRTKVRLIGRSDEVLETWLDK